MHVTLATLSQNQSGGPMSENELPLVRRGALLQGEKSRSECQELTDWHSPSSSHCWHDFYDLAERGSLLAGPPLPSSSSSFNSVFF